MYTLDKEIDARSFLYEYLSIMALLPPWVSLNLPETPILWSQHHTRITALQFPREVNHVAQTGGSRRICRAL